MTAASDPRTATPSNGSPAPIIRSRAPPLSALSLIRYVRLDGLVAAVESHQPGYRANSDAAAAPVGRLTQGQSLLVGHCPQRLPGASLGVSDESIPFAKRS